MNRKYTGKYLLLLVVFFLWAAGAGAQETIWFTDLQREIAIGRELFRTASYNAAYRQFEKIREKADEKSEIQSEAAYYMALSALRSEHSTGEKLLANFISDYAGSPYANYANFYYGEYLYEKERHKQALRSLADVDRQGLSEDDRIKAGYMTGYCYLMTEETDLAANEFLMIKDKNHILARPAKYYYAHINYLKNNYETALEGFRQLEGDPNFSKVIPMYVSQIYYKQQRYNEVVNYVVPIINDVEESHKPELAKIVGDSYFHLRRFSEAIQFLEYYHEMPGPKSREDNYLLGYCYYHTGAWAKAVPLLEGAASGSDQLSQNAFYHLADAYVRTNQKEKARAAFGTASEMEFDDRIREDALFNYAKLTYELSYSPFNETIKAFDRYITLYPNSERNTAAYQYLVEVFMVTRNYRDAIESIEKIKVRNTALNQAYQRVTYYRGLELFGNSAYDQAIQHFDKSLQHNYSGELTAGARFWRAEALYRTGSYSSAVNGFNQFLVTPGAISLSEFNDANYSLGYAYFKLEDYRQAGSAFRKYLNAVQNQRTPKVADAYNRLGDSYFQQREYDEAVRNYQLANSMALYDADYSLYQLAFTSGLQRNPQAKINQLRNLISTYPQSAYVDDAHFELGRTYQQDAKYTEARQEYQTLIDRHRESTYYPKALLQMGLINYNTGDYQNSLRFYKEVAEKFGGTQEAQAALMGIRNCYVEMNEVDSYFTYANQLGGGSRVTASAQDSLTYMAAERQFMAGDAGAEGQLMRYLQQFPNGNFTLNANFYLGETLYNSGKYTQSLEYYQYVSRQPVNIFSEPALSKASELLFNAQKYDEALEMYDRLETISNNKWNTVKAIAGKMRCNFQLERYRNAIDDAARLLVEEKSSEVLMREANYISAKSNYLLGNYEQALTAFRTVSVETNSVQGAEAKYLVAEIHFRRQNLDAAEKEVMDYISKGTPHQFWLAKSFILLADVFEAKKDDFQAKHTLKSLIENYPDQNDGIIGEANARLSRIEDRERTEQEGKRTNPMEIRLN